MEKICHGLVNWPNIRGLASQSQAGIFFLTSSVLRQKIEIMELPHRSPRAANKPAR